MRRVAELFLHGDYSRARRHGVALGAPEMRDSVDVLFVDEAGQMSLANVARRVAGARTASCCSAIRSSSSSRSKGSHPDGVGASALEHMLGEARRRSRRTAASSCRSTWRLLAAASASSRPRCSTTDACRRARARAAGADRRARRCPSARRRGLVSCPSSTTATATPRTKKSSAVAAHRCDDCSSGDAIGATDDGAEQPLARRDILVVAPYNAQVTRLLGAARRPACASARSTSFRAGGARRRSTRWRRRGPRTRRAGWSSSTA